MNRCSADRMEMSDPFDLSDLFYLPIDQPIVTSTPIAQPSVDPSEPSETPQKFYPHLYREYDNDANKGIPLDSYAVASHSILPWKCETGCCSTTGEGHRWRSMLKSRSRRETVSSSGKPVRPVGCPVCASQKTCECGCTSVWSIERLRPFWPGTMEEMKLLPIGSHKKVEWSCPNDRSHRWMRKVCEQVSVQNSCKVCSSIWHTSPHLRLEWPGTMEEMKQCQPGSNAKIEWICSNPVHLRWYGKASHMGDDSHPSHGVQAYRMPVLLPYPQQTVYSRM